MQFLAGRRTAERTLVGTVPVDVDAERSQRPDPRLRAAALAHRLQPDVEEAETEAAVEERRSERGVGVEHAVDVRQRQVLESARAREDAVGQRAAPDLAETERLEPAQTGQRTPRQRRHARQVDRQVVETADRAESPASDCRQWIVFDAHRAQRRRAVERVRAELDQSIGVELEPAKARHAVQPAVGQLTQTVVRQVETGEVRQRREQPRRQRLDPVLGQTQLLERRETGERCRVDGVDEVAVDVEFTQRRPTCAQHRLRDVGDGVSFKTQNLEATQARQRLRREERQTTAAHRQNLQRRLQPVERVAVDGVQVVSADVERPGAKVAERERPEARDVGTLDDDVGVNDVGRRVRRDLAAARHRTVELRQPASARPGGARHVRGGQSARSDTAATTSPACRGRLAGISRRRDGEQQARDENERLDGRRSSARRRSRSRPRASHRDER